MFSSPSSTDTERLFASLDARYLPRLRNLEVTHPRLMVLFSGPPGSGKSTVAKALEQKFHGLRLENDIIRTWLTEDNDKLTPAEKSSIAYRYGSHLWLYLVNRTPNGMWILDSSVDRRYQAFLSFAQTHHFATFLIAMDIPEETHRAWITEGGDRAFNSVSNYLRWVSQLRQEQDQFLEHHTPDLRLGPDYDLSMVFKAVGTRLRACAL